MKKILLHLFYLLAFQLLSCAFLNAQNISFCGLEWTDNNNAYAVDEDNILRNVTLASPATLYTTIPTPEKTSSYHIETIISTNLSNNNQLRFYLQSATAELTDGICIRIGTNSRNITLVKGTTTIIKGDEILVKDNFPYAVSATVNTSTDASGNVTYSLKAFVIGADGTERTTSGSTTVKSTSLPQANYMGLITTFSKDALGKYAITDIEVKHDATSPDNTTEPESPDIEDIPVEKPLPDKTLTFSGYEWNNDSQCYNVTPEKQLIVERGDSPSIVYTSNAKADSIASWSIHSIISTNVSSANQLRFHLLSEDASFKNSLWVRIGTNARNISLMRGEKTVMLHSDTLLNEGHYPYDITATVSRTLSSSGVWKLKINAIVTTSSYTSTYSDSINVNEKNIPQGPYMGIETRFSKSSLGKYLVLSVDTTRMLPFTEEEPNPDEPDIPDTPAIETLPDSIISFSNYKWHNTSRSFDILADNSLSNIRGISPSIITTETSDSIGSWSIHTTISSNVSSANQLRFYLMTDSTDLKNSIWLRIGTNSRNISLMRGTNISMLKSDTTLLPNMFPYEIDAQIYRRQLADDNWRFTVKANVDFDGKRITYEDSITVSRKVVPTGKYMAIEAIYSKTNVGNYAIHDLTTQLLSPLSPTDSLPSVDIPDIPDKPFTPFTAVRGDVVINELMTNPSGLLGLPRCEYVELYNITDSTIVLTGWTIQIGSTVSRIPSSTIAPGGYALLCSNSSFPHLQALGNVVAVSPAPTLTNSGGRVVLRNANGDVIDFTDYSSSIFDGSFKKDGGWSLERIDPYNIANDLANWAPSNNSMGGTPLTSNSITGTFIDITPPSVRSAILSADGNSIDLLFSEPIDPTSLGHSLKLNGVTYGFYIAAYDDVSLLHFTLRLSEPLMRGTVYSLSSLSATDLAGNPIKETDNIRIAITYPTIDANVILSEVMAEASPSSFDYVELHNHGSESYDMRDLCIGVYTNDKLTSCYPLTSYSRTFFPNDYIVICDDSLAHVNHYNPLHPEHVIGNSHFNNLPSQGTIAVCLADGTILDRLDYTSSFHSSMITDTHNVSLERILTNSTTNDPANWTSATFINAYATPTAQNSQNRDNSSLASTSQFSIRQRCFTPDADGIDDEVIVDASLGDGLWTITMHVYSADGIVLATPYNNRPMPVSGELTWNGHSDNGSTLSPGTYIIYISAFSNDGRTLKYKHTCTITTTIK